MCKLKREIKQLEFDIVADKALLRYQNDLLRQRISKPKFLSLAMLSGFILGFLLEHQRIGPHVRRGLNMVPSFIGNVRTVLGLLTI